MADLMPGIPSVPGDETTWQAFTDQFETLKKGDKPISLTNWDTSDAPPAVAAGSAIEVAGATYRWPTESPITGLSGIAVGKVYVVIVTNDPDANSATAYFTDEAPVWRDDLHGWYDATGANRYTGHVMEWAGGSLYTGKRVFTVPAKGGEVFTVGADGRLPDIVTGDIAAGAISGTTGTFSGAVSGTTGTFSGEVVGNGVKTTAPYTLESWQTTSSGEIRMLPVGTYIFSAAFAGEYDGYHVVECYISGSWVNFEEINSKELTLFSNGGSLRLRRTTGTQTYIVHYARI
jgi:uncharacterized protein (DUF2147 family)